MPADFAARVVRWQKAHGRHALPWQQTRDPYRVWLSEVMLQQTQVQTVIGYYQRFLQRFPDVQALAGASLDEVMGLWAGLGYYSRARNLHQCAICIVAQHGGEFPASAAGLQTLPGVGASTAAAIAALCYGQREAILDANVKRVLTRYLGFAGDMASSTQQQLLLEQARALLPQRNLRPQMLRYTQGLMDLGATVCLPRSPDCAVCPLGATCVARSQGRQRDYPVKSRSLRRSTESIWMLWMQRPDGALWLRRRPSPGVWANLYCFPWFDSRERLVASLPARLRVRLRDEPAFSHTLTHKDLYLHPLRLLTGSRTIAQLEGAWFSADACSRLGMPAPVRRLLQDGGNQPKEVEG